MKTNRAPFANSIVYADPRRAPGHLIRPDAGARGQGVRGVSVASAALGAILALLALIVGGEPAAASGAPTAATAPADAAGSAGRAAAEHTARPEPPADPRAVDEPLPIEDDWDPVIDLATRDDSLAWIRRLRRLLGRWMDAEEQTGLYEKFLAEASEGTRLAGRVTPDGGDVEIRSMASADVEPLRRAGDFDLDLAVRDEEGVREFDLDYRERVSVGWGDVRKAVSAMLAPSRTGDRAIRPEIARTFPSFCRFLSQLGRVEDSSALRRGEGGPFTSVDLLVRLDYECIGEKYPTMRDYLRRQLDVQSSLTDGKGATIVRTGFSGDAGSLTVRALRRGASYLPADAGGNPIAADAGGYRALEIPGPDSLSLLLDGSWSFEPVRLFGLGLVVVRFPTLAWGVDYAPAGDGARLTLKLNEAKVDSPVVDFLFDLMETLDLLKRTFRAEWALSETPLAGVEPGGRIGTLVGTWKIERSTLLRSLLYLQDILGAEYRVTDFLRFAGDALAPLEQDVADLRSAKSEPRCPPLAPAAPAKPGVMPAPELGAVEIPGNSGRGDSPAGMR